jgi:hypothetical protein
MESVAVWNRLSALSKQMSICRNIGRHTANDIHPISLCYRTVCWPVACLAPCAALLMHDATHITTLTKSRTLTSGMPAMS